MTILQLKYVIAIDEECSMRKAADKLHVSQPGLSIAIRELENEIGIRIFQRVHHGVVTTVAGRTFIANARSTVEVYEKFEEKFLNSAKVKPTFSVSMQHYTFAVNAFVDLIKENGYDDVQYSVKETQTNEVIENVKTLISEVPFFAPAAFESSPAESAAPSLAAAFTVLPAEPEPQPVRNIEAVTTAIAVARTLVNFFINKILLNFVKNVFMEKSDASSIDYKWDYMDCQWLCPISILNSRR